MRKKILIDYSGDPFVVSVDNELKRKRTLKTVGYKPRFVTEAQLTELYNLYHTARAALDNPTQYSRLLYAAKWFHENHPEISATAAYKDLSAAVARERAGR